MQLRSGLWERSRRGGQAAVLIAMSMFSLVVFMAMATNIGVLVNDRIRVQNAADLAAYGAAYREAQQLNRLVQVNRMILDEVGVCRDSLMSTVWSGYECECINRSREAELVIEACQATLDALANEFLMAASYDQSVVPALDVARSTLNANMEGLGEEGQVDFFTSGSPTENGAYMTESVATIAEFERVDDTLLNYPVLKMCPCFSGCCSVGPVPSVDYAIRTWYYKDDRNPDIWVMLEASGTPLSRFLDIDGPGSGSAGYFGSSSDGGASDKLYAVAVAKPYDGSVGPSELSGVERTGNLSNGGYYTSDGLAYPDATMIDEYRARLAGVREWDEAEASYTPADALSSLYGSDVDRFRH